MTTSIPTKIIPSIFKGNTFDGLVLILTKNVDGVVSPIDLTDAAILVQFKLNYSQINPVFEFKTSDGTAIVSDTNQITLASRNMNYGAYKYIGDIKITLPNQNIQTYCKLEWEILNVVSQ